MKLKSQSPTTVAAEPGMALVTVPSPAVTSAFGEPTVVEITPVVQAYGSRIADARVWTVTATGSAGAARTANNEASLTTGTTAGSTARARTVKAVPYLPGQGQEWRFTAAFPNGYTAGCLQLVGPLHEEDGFAVGWPDDTDSFGFYHLYGRKCEVHSLTITTAAAAAETATVTLNGAGSAVLLTGAGTAEGDAQEIADAGPYTEGSTTWRSWSVGSVVYFQRQAYGDVSGGTYSYASTGTSAASGGVPSEIDGADGTETWHARADWTDPLDGTGVSGHTFDPQYGTIYSTSIGYLGYLGPALYVYPYGTHGPRVLAHCIPWQSGSDAVRPVVDDPRFPCTALLESSTSVEDVEIRTASVLGALHGRVDVHAGPEWAEVFDEVAIGAIGTTEAPIASGMVAPIQGGRANRRRIVVGNVEFGNSGSKQATIRVYLCSQSDLTGHRFVWGSGGTEGVLWVDTSATAIDTSAATLLYAATVPPGSSAMLLGGEAIQAGHVVCITAETASSTTTGTVTTVGHEDP